MKNIVSAVGLVVRIKLKRTTDSWVLFFTKQNDYTNMQMWTNIHTATSYAQGVLSDEEDIENTNENEETEEIECID